MQEKRISSNKDMALYTPLNKIKRIEDFNKNYEKCKNINQSTKNGILEQKKIGRESRLKLKFNKLEIRMNKGVMEN